MHQIKTLVYMQLKDKIDVSWMYSSKSRIRTVVLAATKFIIITLIYTAILWALSKLGLVYYSDIQQIMIFVVSFAMFLSIISCTCGLMKTLYFSEDNKVLITFPVSTNKIYISKLLVFFFYELKRSFSFTIPIILGGAINISIKGFLHWTSYFWMPIPIVFIILLPVLIGALLSIPLMYIYRFVNKYSIIKLILSILLLSGMVTVAVFIINLLPASIDMVNDWPKIREALKGFLNWYETRVIVMSHVTRSIIGQQQPNMVYTVDWFTVLKTFILINVSVALTVLNFFASRPLFLSMMSKNFEFSKNENQHAANIKRTPFITFNIKELKISFRSIEISLNYILIYLLVPLLIFLLNKIFVAIDRNSLGVALSYAFNILLILLPLLSSNSLIATLYSKEGRAAYIKKTKPVNPLIPLLAKLTFNLVLSIPCIIGCVFIFAKFQNINVIAAIILFFAILLIQYAHIFFCATLDISNPQNELYATVGEDVNNINENRASISAFITTILYTLFAFILFREVGIFTSVNVVAIKLFVLSLIIAAYVIITFVLKVKAFYNEA